MNNQKKINLELIKIGNLNERIIRLVNIRNNKIEDIKNEFDSKVNKVYTLIELARERLSKLRGEDFSKPINSNFGIDWIKGNTTETVPVHFKKIPEEDDIL